MTDGRYNEALEMALDYPDSIPSQNSWYPRSLLVAEALEALEEAREAVAILPRSLDAGSGPYLLFDLAAVQARVGEVEEALAVLAEVLSHPAHFWPNTLEDHYRLRFIHDDPRFKALMELERAKAF